MSSISIFRRKIGDQSVLMGMCVCGNECVYGNVSVSTLSVQVLSAYPDMCEIQREAKKTIKIVENRFIDYSSMIVVSKKSAAHFPPCF